MFCPLTFTISRFVRLWPLFQRRGKEPRRERKLRCLTLAPQWASMELMNLISQQQTSTQTHKDFGFIFNHVELEAMTLGGL